MRKLLLTFSRRSSRSDVPIDRLGRSPGKLSLPSIQPYTKIQYSIRATMFRLTLIIVQVPHDVGIPPEPIAGFWACRGAELATPVKERSR